MKETTSKPISEGSDDIFFKTNTAEGLEKIRSRLLDLTQRNKLLNFRHTKKTTLRVVASIPDTLFNRLTDNKSLIFKPIPEPKKEEYQEDNLSTVSKKPSAKQYAEKIGISSDYDLIAHIADNTKIIHPHIQTLHYPLELEAILRKIESSARTAIEETGTNFLYFAFGFLEWLETDTSTQSYLAPLLLIPITITRNKKPNLQTGAFDYSIEYSGEDLAINYCLSEKLRQDFGLDLPEQEDGDTPEKYFKKCEVILVSKPHWRIRRYVTLGFFYFGKLLMYLDLDPNKSNILSHPIIKDLFEGTKIDGLKISENYSIDDPKIEEKVPQIIFDADSSQHSALIDALSGKNLVIEGPPGTGKSQTITNLIAASMVQGKKVLFVSEKLAALEVVRRRLDEAGLGKFCLELHSHKTKKRELLEDLDRRLAFKGHLKDPSQLDHKISSLKRKKSELLYYAGILNKRFGKLGKTIFDILWAETRYREELINNQALLENMVLENAEDLSQSDFDEIETTLKVYSNQLQRLLDENNSIVDNPWYGITDSNLTFLQEKELISKLTKLKTLCIELTHEVSEFSRYVGITDVIELTPRSLCSLVYLRGQDPHLIPRPRGNELFDLLPKLAIQENIQIVKNFLNELYIWRRNLEVIRPHFEQIPIIEIGTVERINEILEKSERFNFSLMNIEDLRIIINDCENLKFKIEKYKPFYQVILSNLFCQINYTASNINHLLETVKIVSNCPFDVLPLRQKSFEDESTIKCFEDAKKEFLNLITTKNQLESNFEIDIDINPEELREHSKSLVDSFFFKRVVSPKYWKAKRQFKKFYRGSKKINPESMSLYFKELAIYKDQLTTFETNNRYKTIFGIHFDGLNTPFDDLLKIIKWYETIRVKLPKHQPDSNSLARALTDSRNNKLRELKTFFDDNQLIIEEIECYCEETKLFLLKVPVFVKNIADDDLLKLQYILDEILIMTDKTISNLSKLYIKHNVSLSDAVLVIDSVNIIQQQLTKLYNDRLAKSIIGQYLPNIDGDTVQLDSTIELAESLHNTSIVNDIKKWLFDQNVSDRLNEVSNFLDKVRLLLVDYGATQSELVKLGGLDWDQWFQRTNSLPIDINLECLTNRIDRAIDAPESLSEWLKFLRIRKKIEQYGFGPLSDLIEKGSISLQELTGAYRFIFFNSLARKIHKKYPALMMEYNGLTLEAILKTFREYDVETIELYRERAACIIDKRSIPPGISTGPVRNYKNLPLITQEIHKKRRNIPIRQLINRAGEALQALKPCFMMGPLSVSQYLAPGVLKFDLLVMDEASQLKPEDALGAIARASQIVIVGDPKQLPPTTFFDRLFNEDENIDEDDLPAIQEAESILDIASSLYQPIRRLNWHYRSRHGSLIAFSNKAFYDNKLIIFPSPITDSKSLGVKYHFISKAIYDNRSNKIEAEYVVNAILSHMKENPRESLGVVCLNSTQKELLERIFEDKIKNDPFAQNYMDARQKGAEPFFIKNLENVQGDERDVIFISITYGRDAKGNFFQRFGPINGINGHRRLNVLFTRAKKRTEVFTSIDPDEIKLTPNSQQGLHALKGYLNFAKKGFIESLNEGMGQEPNDFEISVGNALTNRSYDVVHQVGVAGFYIDLAVRHPNKPGSYILGIECDGATYHSARSVRERDRLRQDILENLGWTIYRIWSTDWFSNKKKEIDKILATIDRIFKSDKSRDREPIVEIAQIPFQKTPSLFEKIIEEIEPIKPTQKPPSDKLFLTVEEARKQLIDLRERVIKKEFPDAAAENGLLRKSMLDMLLKELPTDKKEFLSCIPLSLRDKTDAKQMKYIEEVFNILAEVVA